MSLLPSATFATSIAPTGGASDYAANALWATAGAAGPGGGVTQLVAGANITLDPPTGEGVVTITAAGGGAGGVTSVTSGGPGITCIPTTGAVVVDNTGVTSLVAGTAMSISGATGAVTVNNAGVTSLAAGPGIAVSAATGGVTVSTVGFPVFTGFQTFSFTGSGQVLVCNVTSNSGFVNVGGAGLFTAVASGYDLNGSITLTNPAWNAQTIVLGQLSGVAFTQGGSAAPTTLGIARAGNNTQRVVTISGPASSGIPNNLDGGNPGFYFIVIQGAL
jgi:hypothetical protein